ncbi:MAG: zinc-ribbon domain-containing protein [Patescibacteria group bacterium]|nr:zinc-ribbon domain-containing protein [Patescibacteria group bacterium]
MTKIKESDLEDRTLICKDCGKKFIWTAGEQKFFLDKGLKNIPKRCKICTAQYKTQLREKHPAWWIKCSVCGKKAEVSFEPKSEDILCEDCFNKKIEKRDQAIKALGEEVPV